MIIQNATGRTTIFKLGRRSNELASGATWAVPDDDAEVFRDARRLEEAGHLIIIEAPADKQILGSRTLPANGTITFSGVGTEDDTIVIGGRTYELSADSSIAAGNVEVVIGGTAAETAENLADAINGDALQTLVKAVDVGAVVYLAHKTNGVDGSGVALDASGSSAAAASGATLTDGLYGSPFGAVIATVAADGNDVVLNTGLAAISHFLIQVRDASNTIKPYTGVVTVEGGVLIADENTEIANTDLVTFIVFG